MASFPAEDIEEHEVYIFSSISHNMRTIPDAKHTLCGALKTSCNVNKMSVFACDSNPLQNEKKK